MSTSSGPSEQEILAKYQSLQGELQQTYQKVSELEGEVHEYGVVSTTLTECDPDRKCFRMIGGVLVERVVKEVLPALTERKTQIEAMVTMLKGKMEQKAKELDGFRTKYGIQPQKGGGATVGNVMPGGGRAGAAGGGGGGGGAAAPSAGVLV